MKNHGKNGVITLKGVVYPLLIFLFFLCTSYWSSEVNANVETDYTITFVDEEGRELQSGSVAYGQTPVFSGETPTKEASAQYSFSFSGWSPAISPVTGDTTYTATFDATVNNYTIKFENEDGTELQSVNVAYGQTPAYSGETPTKEATAQYTYTFKGWSPAISPVTEDMMYTATYDATVNNYTIKFVNEDGTVLQSGNVAYGQIPAYSGETPTKEATAQYSFSFLGWLPAISSVTEDMIYTATYDATVNNYTIKFVNEDGTELQSGSVAYGQTPAYSGETPTKEATAQYSFSFSGWSPAISPVAGDKTYVAVYSSQKITKLSGEEGTIEESSGGSGGSVPSGSSGNPSGSGTLPPVQASISETLKEETQQNMKENNVSQKDDAQRVSEQINSDGSKTITIIETISDGTVITKILSIDKNNNIVEETVIRERTTSSGTKITLKEIKKSDGTIVKEDHRLYKSGKTVIKKETWESDNVYSYVKTVLNIDGSSVIDVEKTYSDGSTEKAKINIDKEGKTTVSAIISNKTGTISEVPDVIVIDGKKYKVDKVNEKAFFKNSTLTSVVLGKNIAFIGDRAFNGAENLSTITILSQKIKTIEDKAFYGISKNAVIKIKAGKRRFKTLVNMIKASKIKKSVKFERVE